jgi:thimet oligopeptidase
VTEPLLLPTAPDVWADWLRSRIDASLDAATLILDELKDGTQRSADEIVRLWNDCDVALDNADALAHTLSELHPDAAVRTLAEEGAQRVSRVRTDRGLDEQLFAVVSAADARTLDDAGARRLHDRILRDFRRSGVDRPAEVRDRLRAIAERLTVLEQDFGRAVRDDVRSIRVRPEQLDGLPADFVAAHQPDEDGLVSITTDYPDYIPFLTFATDAIARHELAVEFLNRAYPVNEPVLREMLDLRAEQAGLLGYDSWPDYDAEVKMVGSGAEIAEFIEKVAQASGSAAQRDYELLLARRRRDDPDATTLTRADSTYYEELIRREDFDVDAQQVRRYFDFANVRAGLLDVTARLFGVEYWQRTEVPVWHEDVAVYDVLAEGMAIGRIYLDLHPRDGKFKHAAQFTLVNGVTGRQLPEGVLACNFSRGLMEHSDVVTLFHEFGHLVHHVVGGNQPWARFSGVTTEWDFVEAPSQMLEEWAWDPEVLRSFARDENGEPIPRELVTRMRAAKEFGVGLFVRAQLAYAAVSFLLHRDRPDDFAATIRDVQQKYVPLRFIDGTHFHTSFGHLAGYTSAYYTYMWSLVIAKDMFSAFDRENLLDPAVAQRYRDAVLAPGGSADAADLVADFLGRPYRFDAFEQWLNETPAVSRT